MARFQPRPGPAPPEHPGIVPSGAGEHGGQRFSACAKVEGEPRPAGPRPPGPREAAGILADVARAVQYAHGADLHPRPQASNVLIDGDGRQHITEFGSPRA